MSTEAEQEKARTLLEGEVATRTHIQDVSRLMSVCAAELLVRGSHHDESKLGPEEHEKFSLAAARFKEPGNEFGTEGYEKTKEWLGSALAHHYEKNSHHPEHYANGVMGMDLFDLIEMLMDWVAASARRSPDGVVDLELNRKHQQIPTPIMLILQNTLEYAGYPHKGISPEADPENR